MFDFHVPALALRAEDGLSKWLDGPELVEAELIANEMHAQAIARETGQHCLPTASLDWEAMFVSGTPPGALTTVVARETLTRQANRRRWDRQKRLRSGVRGLFAAIHGVKGGGV
jgi:hypothetical protein